MNIKSIVNYPIKLIAFVDQLNIKAEKMCFPDTWSRQESITEITGYNSYHLCRNNIGMGCEISIEVEFKYKSVQCDWNFFSIRYSMRSFFLMRSVIQHYKIVLWNRIFLCDQMRKNFSVLLKGTMNFTYTKLESIQIEVWNICFKNSLHDEHSEFLSKKFKEFINLIAAIFN